MGYQEGVACFTGNFVDVYIARKDWKGAESLAREALSLTEKVGRQHSIGQVCHNLAIALLHQEKAVEALPFARRAVEILTKLGSRYLASAQQTLAECEHLSCNDIIPGVPTMTRLTWLHLSDWHQKGLDFDRIVVLDALLKDIRQRKDIDPSLEHVDFVIFSGDLAYYGQTQEFEEARKQLLDPVLEAVGLKPERLFLVPGNHDLDRNHVYDMLPPELQKPLDSDALVQRWLVDDSKRSRVLEPFKHYKNFVANYTGQNSPDYDSILRLDVAGKKIALLGLNSAWMCGRHKDSNGEVNDDRHVLVGEPQIHAALQKIADADVKIAVLHHPLEWLAEFDRNRVKNRLFDECHFILHGHEHQPQVQISNSNVGQCVIIPAGASYDRRVASHPRYTNAYNWVSLDFATGEGIVYLRCWSDQINKWREDIDAHKLGLFSLKPLPKNIAVHHPQDAKDVATATSLPESRVKFSKNDPPHIEQTEPLKKKNSSALAIWQEKISYLREQEAILADAAQKFALKKQIEEVESKIQELGGEL